MLKKSIAAALLVAMVAWAEMALAPMLAMHAGHVHRALEMSAHNTAHQHVMPAGHPCCPGIGKTTEDAAPADFAFAAGSPPCQDEHRCCFRQGPQSVPAAVSAGKRLSDIAPATAAELSRAGASSHVFPATTFALGPPPPGRLGMVLRV